MDLLAAIETRSSAGRLTAPGPNDDELMQIMRAAGRAPDHGRLQPWRMFVLQGDVRVEFLQAAAAAKLARIGGGSVEQRAAEVEKMSRSPTIVVIACQVRRDQSKIPEIEQVVAVGAAAQNLFLAAHDLGYGVMWKTGAAAYDPSCKQILGLAADDHIVGIMHLGTRVK